MKKFKKIVEMITNNADLSEIEKEIYTAFNANKPLITWDEHETLYKLINIIYNK